MGLLFLGEHFGQLGKKQLVQVLAAGLRIFLQVLGDQPPVVIVIQPPVADVSSFLANPFRHFGRNVIVG